MTDKFGLTKILLLPIAVYLIWTAATFLFEGRIHQMLRYDPFERALYILIANIFAGIILASWAIKAYMSSASEDRADLGFRSRGHTLLAVSVTLILGLVLFLIQNPTNTLSRRWTYTFSQAPVTCWQVIN